MHSPLSPLKPTIPRTHGYDLYIHTSIVPIHRQTTDDNPYLREWVEFYIRVMGVGRIYIYDGQSKVPQSAEVKDWIDRGFVKYMYVTEQVNTQVRVAG